jgi:membrane protease YdiL (CAAX protease family)
MTAQTASTNIIGKETTHTNWLQRLGLFTIFLVCGFAILVFGSIYLKRGNWKLSLGIGCGYLMMKTDNIWGATIIHAAADLFAFIALLANA